MEGAEARAKRNLVLTHIVLIIMSFIMLVPFVWMILTALKTNQEAISVDPFYIFPAHGWHWENFATVWTSYNFLILYSREKAYVEAQKENMQIKCFSIDQEGGRVTRIRKGATVFPSALAIGSTMDADNAYLAGYMMGSEMKALGIYHDFAPVMDCNFEDDKPLRTNRSYGTDVAEESGVLKSKVCLRMKQTD